VAVSEIGGYSLPAGAFISVSQFATHRHPRFWDHAEPFDPARFISERERAPPARLLPVRRRPTRLHRIALRHAGVPFLFSSPETAM
jgi:cytochrome P450